MTYRSRNVASHHVLWRILGAVAAASMLAACPGPAPIDGHGPIAENIGARLGDPVPFATPEQLATFERGSEVALRRFSIADGLGPAFNVTFCTSCHEKPQIGGGGALYRNFFLSGIRLPDGSFLPGESAGQAGGVIRLYQYGDGLPARPAVPEETNVIAQRNPIPFFGVGLLAEIPEREILSREDPDDRNHDGISGRANYARGFVSRFGRKAQASSIEAFIRGPLFNHVGITSNPLTDEEKAALPVDSSGAPRRAALWVGSELRRIAQASAPDSPTVDFDHAPDPELSNSDLFDLVSMAMLMAPPVFEALSEAGLRGRDRFDEAGCGGCHTPRLQGPRGPIPTYSDLLIHDMGPDLADGLEQGLANGSEFRTQPLWGIVAVAPYLHDGRADTIEQAIVLHGGEGQRARDAFAAMTSDERADLVEFLNSLGGRDQETAGRLEPNAPVPAPGAYGGPLRALTASEEQTFVDGRTLFDRDFGRDQGVGQPRLNGDSCRACHFDPVIGGSGPRGVNVIRHGILNSHGAFVAPEIGTILHRTTTLMENANRPQPEANIFEQRQPPALFGLGLIDSIPDAAILANADPDDTLTPDGISGRASYADGGRLGRFGWKAQIPSVREFVRDAFFSEMGMTLPYEPGQTFGRLQDTDGVPDPEVSIADVDRVTAYLVALAPPPRVDTPEGDVARGETLFTTVGCASCHTPELPGAGGPVPLYSDLLLHDVAPPGAVGIEDASADMREFRTPPLWGASQSAPYMHSGEADTRNDAILMHDTEGTASREAFLALSAADQDALLAFVGSL